MSGSLTKLSETRWQYSTGRRVYYLRQLKAPNEDRMEPGVYAVDGGESAVRWIMADSVEQVTYELSQAQPAPKPQGADRLF